MEAVKLSYRDMNMFVPIGKPARMSIQPQEEEFDVQYGSNNSTCFFVIYVTDLCNMNCVYCFSSQNNPMGKNSAPIYSYEDMHQFILRNRFDKITIRFFGGEPLLNKAWIIKFIDFFADKNIEIEYQIFTNLTLLDEDFLGVIISNNITLFSSIDTTSKARINSSGNQLIKEIDKAIFLLQEKEIIQNVYIRYVIQNNCNVLEQMEWLFDKGFKFISLTLPWATKSDNQPIEMKVLEKMMDELVDFYIYHLCHRNAKKINIHPITSYLSMLFGDNNIIDKHQCGSGINVLSISTEGDIYPCHAFNGVKEFEQGKITQMTYIKNPFQNIDCNTTNCQNCDIKYFCRTKCLADCYFLNGSIYSVIKEKCEFERLLLSASVYIYNKLKTNYPKEYFLYEKIFRRGDKIYGSNN